MIRRAVDLVCSGLGLLLLGLPMLLTALLIRLDSPGGALFRQQRIGMGGLPFEILKFRTMRVNTGSVSLTVGEDPRVTRIGRFLRQAKIDELPQLINVFKGDMSLVGPRPEVPEYAFLYPEQDRVWSVRPGITDPTAIRYRNENQILEGQADPEKYYVEVLLREKTQGYLEYLENRTLVRDLGVIFETIWKVALGPSENKGAD